MNRFLLQFVRYSFSVSLLILPMTVVAADGDTISFTESVRPILTRHCSRCHGDRKSEGGLSLSIRKSAFAPADSEEPVIVPGDSDASLLIKRIVSDGLGDQMPADGQPLSADEIKTLRTWIDQGAKWPDGIDGRHWAYIKPTRPALPDVTAPAHGNAIDRFIAVELTKARLEPNRRATKAKLLRRVSLTLTGLPPSIEQLDAFLADESDDAYEKVVDRLLASKRYGERWAQHWLDLARYADSNGFQADQLREIWAYRDWVINALNADMPFDQFTIEQLAGDLLPNATIDQRIATGFHRTVTTNVEAGVHPEENRHNQVFDRVNTTGTVFLAATVECAQCHDHKYDPISQEEYYRLFAFFNNTPLEVKLNSGVQWELDGPEMDLPLPPAQQAKYDDLQRKVKAVQKELAAVTGSAKDRRRWENRLTAAVAAGVNWEASPPTRYSSTGGEDLSVLEDGSVLVGGMVPKGKTHYELEFAKPVQNVTAIRMDALLHDSLPGKGPGRGDKVRNNFVLNELTLSVRRGDDTRQLVLHSPTADFSQVSWKVEGLIDGDSKSGWAIAPQFSKPHHVTLLLARPLTLADGETLVVGLQQNFGSGRTLGRVLLSTYSGEPAAVGVSPQIAAAIKKPRNKRSKAEKKRINDYYTSSDRERKRLQAQVARMQKQVARLKPPTTLVMVEMEKARESRVLNRGNYLDPGTRVTAGTPSVFHGFDSAQFEPNRLGLAKWLVSKDNPVVARVVVNRWWTEMFGRGIVETPEDFGTQSEPPTHPQLLDWLSDEFMASGWSMKHMHKLMVMSAAFQRSSAMHSESLQLDPKNRWYSRGPRYRLSAETIRDNALAISGLLSAKMGGSPVMPYQPGNIWRAVGRNAPKWKTAKDSDRFRRGVYVVWRRAAPYPSFVNFDAPDRAACVVNRARTNTPLQALTLLNDPAYLEMAFGLAERMMSGGDAAVDRIQHGFRLCVARKASGNEVAVLADVYQTELARLRANPKLANQLFKGVAEYSVPVGVDRIELAAWFAVANTLLNLDETITNG